MTKHLCTECYGGHVEDARAMHLIRNNLRMTCMQCGEKLAKEKAKAYTVVPMNKSNYMLVTDLTQLRQLNPKRTT